MSGSRNGGGCRWWVTPLPIVERKSFVAAEKYCSRGVSGVGVRWRSVLGRFPDHGGARWRSTSHSASLTPTTAPYSLCRLGSPASGISFVGRLSNNVTPPKGTGF